MEILGKLTKILPEETGTTKSGSEWKKQIAIFDTGNQYNPEVAISFSGEKIHRCLGRAEIGKEYTVSVNISSREYNGKFYHNINGWFMSEGFTKEIPEMKGTKDMLEDLSISNNDNVPF
jgi:hypothetical protein